MVPSNPGLHLNIYLRIWEKNYSCLRKVGKKAHTTIPKGNLGYDQYTVSDTVAVESTFVAFFYHMQTYIHGVSFYFFRISPKC